MSPRLAEHEAARHEVSTGGVSRDQPRSAGISRDQPGSAEISRAADVIGGPLVPGFECQLLSAPDREERHAADERPRGGRGGAHHHDLLNPSGRERRLVLHCRSQAEEDLPASSEKSPTRRAKDRAR